MLTKILSLFSFPKKPVPKPIKKIAFLDGDQNVIALKKAYDKYLVGTNTEVNFVRMGKNASNIPRKFRNLPGINNIVVEGTAGKEVVDKFIAGYIHRAICEQYTEITVVSSDYDFVDIFKMATQINNVAQNVTFRIIAPNPRGRLNVQGSDKIANIQIIKMN